MTSDMYSEGRGSGVDIRSYPDGLYISGWYDTYVGIEGMFVTWEELDALRKKARRRKPYGG